MSNEIRAPFAQIAVDYIQNLIPIETDPPVIVGGHLLNPPVFPTVRKESFRVLLDPKDKDMIWVYYEYRDHPDGIWIDVGTAVSISLLRKITEKVSFS